MYLITFMKLLLKLLGFDELITEIEYLQNKEKENIKLINDLTTKLKELNIQLQNQQESNIILNKKLNTNYEQLDELNNKNKQLEKQAIEFDEMYKSCVANAFKLRHNLKNKLLSLITNDLNIMITNEDLF